MKTLLLLTNSFPFGEGEEFIPAELKRISGFDRVLIAPCSCKPGAVRTKPLPDGVVCLPVQRTPIPKSAYLSLIFKPQTAGEIFRMAVSGRLRADRIHELLYFLKNAEEIFRAVSRKVSFAPGEEVVIYSYWLYDAAAAGVMLAESLRKRGVKVRQISRAHGFDIHAERSKTGYLPMRTFLFRNIDRIFACSEDGARSLRNEAGKYGDKIRCSYLGTEDLGMGLPGAEPFHLISCSYMVPVKRLDLLAHSLGEADFPVVWTHIGSGPEEKAIRSLAGGFPASVKAEFPGAMANRSVLSYYQTHQVSAFVNVSSSEGIPVTVMEACSFGIPVLATDVGGTKEIVKDGRNGRLLPKDITPEELCGELKKFSEMSAEQYRSMCTASRQIWSEKFSAESNYRKFYAELNDWSQA